MGMVGGGRNATIGVIHQMAARLDGKIDLVAGAFSSNAERIEANWGGTWSASLASIQRLSSNGGGGSKATSGRANRLRLRRYTESFALPGSRRAFQRLGSTLSATSR